MKELFEKIISYSAGQRQNLIRKGICLFFIIGILMSGQLWLSDRFFPVVPVFDFIPEIANAVQFILIGAFVLTLGLGIFYSHPLIFRILFCLLFVLLMQDQMRWQPWVYIYALLLIPYLIKKKETLLGEFMPYFQIVLIGIYVWSGIHKLNPNFIDFTYTNILTHLFRIKDPGLIQTMHTIGYVIPLVEIATGLALLIPRFRNMAVFVAISTHLFILLYLSPLGINDNAIVYPWNMAMILLVSLSFLGTTNSLDFWKIKDMQAKLFTLGVGILCWLMPALSFFNMWDNYLSFSLYSDKPHKFFIAIAAAEIPKIDPRLKNYYEEIEGMEGGEIIDINKWAADDLQVPFYPEQRCFKKVARQFCKLGIESDKLMFLEFERPLEAMKYQGFYCKDL